jgi:ubiquinone/menaquinone biosynthesis C-methylase UbiE
MPPGGKTFTAMTLCGDTEKIETKIIMIEPFEKYTEEYAVWFTNNKFAYLSELNLLKQLVPKRGAGLDIGCGTGVFTAPLNIKIGVEPSKKMSLLAKEKGLNVYNAVAEKLPFANNSFDHILMVTTICFLDNLDKALVEIRRVLKPKGHLIIGFVGKDSFLGKYYLKKKAQSKFYKKAVFYSVESILSILKKYNFETAKILQTLFVLPNKLTKTEKIKNGYGEGGFVGISAKKI